VTSSQQPPSYYSRFSSQAS